jgi:hypothetical protein
MNAVHQQQAPASASSAAIQIPALAEGEIYVGCIGDAAGNLHHVILLPGDNDYATWKDQMAWAKSIGGDLPNRIEQAMLFANFRDQFKRDWYWSCDPHASVSDYAWGQRFYYGRQGTSLEGSKLRARAVRRSAI